MSLKALSFRRRTLNPSNFKRTQDERSNLESKWDPIRQKLVLFFVSARTNKRLHHQTPT